jgi:Zn-finger protein
MNEDVEMHGTAWKFKDIEDNVEWSKQQTWQLKQYDNHKDHEHCLICYWTIGVSDSPETGEGYFYGGSTWLCLECYEKFVK